MLSLIMSKEAFQCRIQNFPVRVTNPRDGRGSTNLLFVHIQKLSVDLPKFISSEDIYILVPFAPFFRLDLPPEF